MLVRLRSHSDRSFQTGSTRIPVRTSAASHLLDEVLEGDVGAVEPDRGGDVGDLDLLAEERHVDDAERGDRALRPDLDVVAEQHAAPRADAVARREVDQLARRATAADEAAVVDGVEERREARAGRVVVHHRDRLAHGGDRRRRRPAAASGIVRRARRSAAEHEVGDVGDRSPWLVGPHDVDACTGGDLVGTVDGDGVQHRRVGAVEPDQRPGERRSSGFASFGTAAMSTTRSSRSTPRRTHSSHRSPVTGSNSTGGTWTRPSLVRLPSMRPGGESLEESRAPPHPPCGCRDT